MAIILSHQLVHKVIITMVIRPPLDNRTYCVRSAFTQLGVWQKLYDCSRHKFGASKCLIKRTLLTFSRLLARQCVPFSSTLIHFVHLLSFLSYVFTGSKSVSVRPPVWPGYDNKHNSRSYPFVERQQETYRVDTTKSSKQLSTRQSKPALFIEVFRLY